MAQESLKGLVSSSVQGFSQDNNQGVGWCHLKACLGMDLLLIYSCGFCLDSVPPGFLDQGPWFLAGCWPEAALIFSVCGPPHRAAHKC